MQIKVVRFKVMGALQDTVDVNPTHKNPTGKLRPNELTAMR